MHPQHYGDVNRVGPYAPGVQRPPERWGILGGTFDPVQIGHVVACKKDPRGDAEQIRSFGGAWLAIEEYDDVLADGVASFPLPIGAMPGVSTAYEGKPINDIST